MSNAINDFNKRFNGCEELLKRTIDSTSDKHDRETFKRILKIVKIYKDHLESSLLGYR